MNEKPG